MARSIIALLALCSLSACATVPAANPHVVYLQDGSQGYQFTCTINTNCDERAAEICGSKGYMIRDTSFSSSMFDVSTVKQSITCGHLDFSHLTPAQLLELQILRGPPPAAPVTCTTAAIGSEIQTRCQ
jgi:hypothetical protein